MNLQHTFIALLTIFIPAVSPVGSEAVTGYIDGRDER
jgi:hypothetical protein